MAKKRLAIVLRPGVEPEVRVLAQTLEDLRSVINGYVEHVNPQPGLDVWCDEDGIGKGLPVCCHIPQGIGEHVIVGDAVLFVVGGKPEKLSDKEWVMAVLKKYGIRARRVA